MTSLSTREMEQLTRGLETKSEQIRRLGRAGVRPADIARFLGIRYQHAYNVLRDANLRGTRRAPQEAAAATDSMGPDRAVLEDSGRIAIPEAVLSAWSAEPGEELIVRLEGDELRIMTRRAGLERARGIVRKYVAPGEELAEELLHERRAEAANEDD